MKIEGRKYEKTLPDGRIISRQREYQIRHPEKLRALQARWRNSESGKRLKHETYIRYRDKLRETENDTNY